MDILALEQWLLDRPLEHSQSKHIFELACDYLRQQKIVRPGTVCLADMVSTARSQAEIKTYEQLQIFLTPERRQFFDDLLTVDEEIGRTGLTWLQRTPQSNRGLGVFQHALRHRHLLVVKFSKSSQTRVATPPHHFSSCNIS
jgi:hypothetical protein